MNSAQKELLNLINLNNTFSAEVKSEIESLLKKIDRQVVLDTFKINKLESTIKTISLLLNQNIKDIEGKSLEISRQNEIIIQQKYFVETKQKEIIESINYAKRIQNTILPPSNFLKDFFQDSFILYKPKDIVAGDFYWIEKKEDTLLFAVCDCTGHGVPGALVSIVCNNALNRSVREFNLTKPSKILDKTSEIIIENFSTYEETISDGMDISMCAFNLKTKTLEWAGANNPLWIINKKVITEFKPDKQPIGKFENSKNFTNNYIQLKNGDTIYLFTDGYADQFGGKKGKKFKASKFKELLLSIHTKTMEVQRQIILAEIETWKGNLEQVDDICVMGVKI